MIPPNVFIFNLVVSKLYVVKFAKFFENLFFQINTKRKNSPKKKNRVNFIQIKNKDFQYFPNIFVALVQIFPY
jgi:hypothetical protein